MSPPHTMRLAGRADWALMTAVHDALPLISQIMSPGEIGQIAVAIRGGLSIRHAGTTVPWALTDASPGVREQVLSQLPAPARLLYRTVWLPRYARITPAL